MDRESHDELGDSAERTAETVTSADPDESSPTASGHATQPTVPHRPSRRPSTISPVVEGTRIGRFTIRRRLGSGGMGAVYEAHDPELERDIAIKLLSVNPGGGSGDAGALNRLVREAQALARLSHPNVVAIYDVGEWHGDVFLALELVDGPTLSEWVRKDSPGYSEILEAYIAAGRGLAAAHKKQLIHRDFKPSNVIHADDGRVRVLDFGLARTSSNEVEDLPDRELTEDDDDSSSSMSGALDVKLTKAGTILGTPAYMSPEQHRGRPTDAKSDQFSFCVALYEALYGERPFAGRRRKIIGDNVCNGRVRDAPSGIKVPTWLRPILLRGLSVAPNDRYPSMDELLADLSRDPAARRRRILTGALVVTGIVAAATLGRWSSDPEPEITTPALCAGGQAEIADAWTPEHASAVAASFGRTSYFQADDAARRVDTLMRAYQERWSEAYTTVCEATRVSGVQSEALLDLRMGCLARNRAQMEGLFDLFSSQADAKLVENAPRAVANLSGAERCVREVQRGKQAPPPARADDIAASYGALDRAAMLEQAGRYEDGSAEALKVVTRAEELDYPSLQAAAALRAGSLLERTSKLDEARALLEDAMAHAGAAGDAATLAHAHGEWLFLVGYRQGKLDEATANLALARGAVALADDDQARGSFDRAMGAIRMTQGKLPEARAHFQAYLAASERLYGPDDFMTAGALNNLATTLLQAGDVDAATPLFERVRTVTTEVVGADHPSLAPILQNIGWCHDSRGDVASQEKVVSRALKIERRAYGEDHPGLAMSYYSLANARRQLGRHDQARQDYERALALQLRHLGPKHPYVVGTLDGLGLVALAQRDFAKADDYFGRAYELAMEVLGPKHPHTAATLASRASSALEAGRLKHARRWYEQAAEIVTAAYGPKHPEVAQMLTGRARAETNTRRKRELLERAVGIYDEHTMKTRSVARARFELAKTLWLEPAQRMRAVALAKAARGVFDALGDEPEVAARRQEVDGWLASRASR